ncbi:MAG TPA: gliding motility lipoprotein GldH [Chitinophagales bacterium]|nr:gliding motility lipoprotein GldH [Chitinophagales bacterium]
MSLNKHTYYLIPVIALLFILSGCEQSRVFDKNISLPKQGWFYDEAKTFEVEILDTAKSYNLYINVRHTDEYPYNNLWLKLTTTLPDGSVRENNVNIELSAATGEWSGNCVDGICYNSVLIQHNFSLPQKGKYVFSLEQDMRMNPIPYIMDIGIRVEKFM